MVIKNYLRYEAEERYGVITSPDANAALFLTQTLAATPALEDVNIWNLKTRELVSRLRNEGETVTFMCKAESGTRIAVGYLSGEIQVWDYESGESLIVFSGHRSAVTSMAFNATGTMLLSGSQDTDIIIWDIVNEAGLYRLRGHKGPVHRVAFSEHRNMIFSCSKDGLVKFWDLDTQHCVHTLVGHRDAVTDFVLLEDEKKMITGSTDDELRVWDIEYKKAFSAPKTTLEASEGGMDEDEDDGDAVNDETDDVRVDATRPDADRSSTAGYEENERKKPKLVSDEALHHPIVTTSCGSIVKKGQGKTMTLTLSPKKDLLICHNASKMIDMFRVRSQEELKKKAAKRVRNLRKKMREKGEDPSQLAKEDLELQVTDFFPHSGLLICPGTVCSIDLREQAPASGVLASSSSSSISSSTASALSATYGLLVALNNNAFETYDITRTPKEVSHTRTGFVALQGHRKPVRALSLSADASLVLTTSNTTAKLWNRVTGQCILTLEDVGYGVSCQIVPGNRHALVGTKTGALKLYDLTSGECLDNIEEAHTHSVWSIALQPDKQGFVTGSADKNVKFWQFELVESPESIGKVLTIEHTRTLQMTDEVTSVAFSPDQELLAVSLLDNTVKVIYSDSLKPFLSLYGHKLPVTCMAISRDNTLLATGSADKNVKIWGLDFGDCHKSFRAHQDTVTSVSFAGTTHYVFSTSKDKTIKQWDADSFRLIQTLEGHQNSVSCGLISEKGDVFVSGSHDRSIRTWRRTREMLNVDEELALQREQKYDDEQAEQEGREYRAKAGDEEVATASKRSAESLKAAEKLIQALDVALKEQTEGDTGVRDPLLIAYRAKNGQDFVRIVLDSLRSSEIEQALMLLPTHYVEPLLKFLCMFVEGEKTVERSCRCVMYLMRLHHKMITTTSSMLPIVERLRSVVPRVLSKHRELIGYNSVAGKFVQRQIEEHSTMYL